MKGKKITYKEKMLKLDNSSIERKKMFAHLCAHVANGLSLESFSEITDHTIYRYLKEYPEDFVKEDLEIAKKKGRDWWETCGRRQSSGDCLGNSRTWFYNMANRFGWRERLDIEAEHKGSVNVNVVSYSSKKPSESISSDL